MATNYPRNMVGYGASPPNPEWPGNARLAINFVMNFEEGSEYSIPDGDGFADTTLTESIGDDLGGRRDLAAESMFEYGSRIGFWRIHRLFQERAMTMTVFACALALERNPAAAQAIREAGYDICSHGWRWVKHWNMDEQEERVHIQRAVKSLTETTGSRPFGWYCRYGPSENTRRLLVEEGGFLYDSDAYNDELPYWVKVEGKPHLVVPYSLCNNDIKFAGGNVFSTSMDFFNFVKDAFDMLYLEGKTMPKMMSVGFHMRLIGHPARAAGLARFLDYVNRHKDVWVCSRVEIARHWIEHHPFEE